MLVLQDIYNLIFINIQDRRCVDLITKLYLNLKLNKVIKFTKEIGLLICIIFGSVE